MDDSRLEPIEPLDLQYKNVIDCNGPMAMAGRRAWLVRVIPDQRGIQRVAGRGCPLPAPTPPYVRFRIRRFTRCTQAFDAHRGSSGVPVAAASRLAPPGSCDWHRRSTKVLCRFRLTPWPVPGPDPVVGVSRLGSVGVSTAATECSGAFFAATRPRPRNLP